MRAAVLVAIVAWSSLAHADPPGLTPPTTLATPAREPKQRAIAYLATLGGAFVSLRLVTTLGDWPSEQRMLLTAGSVVLLPSAGHWYAGKFFTPGMAIRLAGVAFVAWSVNE